MFNFTIIPALFAGFKYYTFSAYNFVPGEWMEMNIVNRTFHYPMNLIEIINTTDGNKIAKYHISINSTQVSLTITSDTHVKVKYGDIYPEFEIDIIQKPKEVAIFDGYLPDGIYAMMTFYGQSSIEISLVFPEDKSTIHTYGFFKVPPYKMNYSDYLMIFGIALFLTYLFKKFTSNYI